MSVCATQFAKQVQVNALLPHEVSCVSCRGSRVCSMPCLTAPHRTSVPQKRVARAVEVG
jgi:hypothetical protein